MYIYIIIYTHIMGYLVDWSRPNCQVLESSNRVPGLGCLIVKYRQVFQLYSPKTYCRFPILTHTHMII